VVYLLQFNTFSSLDLYSPEKFPLTEYAAKYWTFHARFADGTFSSVVLALYLRFLDRNTAAFNNWLQFDGDLNLPHGPSSEDVSHSETIPALYYTTRAGILQLSQLLLDNGADVNAHGGRDGNPLQIASYEGYEHLVKLFLERGADANLYHEEGSYEGSSLQLASSRGHRSIVALLLNAGADVKGVYIFEYDDGILILNALQAAACTGHEDIVDMLLGAGAREMWDVNLGYPRRCMD